MATETNIERRRAASSTDWRAGVIGGIAGGIVMGAAVVAMNAATMAVAIPSLYGLAPPPNVPVGLAVHVFHGAVLGAVFAWIAGSVGVASTGRILALGAGWGVATWVLLAGLLMPVWLGAVGSPASPPFPNFAPPSLLWHLIYGLVLGGVFAGARSRLRADTEA